MNIVLDERARCDWGARLVEAGFEVVVDSSARDQTRPWHALGGEAVASVLRGDGAWESMFVIGDVGFSQFDAIVRMMRENRGWLREPLAAFAIEGTGFHGNRQRKWVACSGNVHLSCFRPLDLDASQAACLSMIPTLAVCDSVESFLDASAPRPGIKWINDVYLDGRKLSGALTHTEVIDGRITGVAYGIGLNVEVAPGGNTDATVGAAAFLKSQSATKTHASVVALELLDKLAARIAGLDGDGPAAILEDYRSRSICLGRRVEIVEDGANVGASENSAVAGRLVTINSDLSLEIEGYETLVTRGRIVAIR